MRNQSDAVAFLRTVLGWLSPVQLLLIPVNENSYVLAQKIQEMLMAEGIRAKVGNRSGSLGKRIAMGRRLRPFLLL